MSPLLQGAIEERLEEMSSRQSAHAAAEAQRHFKIARKHPNIHNPWLHTARYALDLLVGVYLNENAEKEGGGC